MDRRALLTLVCAVTGWGCGDDSPSTTGSAGTTGTDATTTEAPTTSATMATTMEETSSSSTTEPDDTTTSVTTSGSSTTEPVTGSSSEGSTTMMLDDSSTSTTGGPVCETVLCGLADVCCLADEECVLDNCLPACDSGVRCGDAQDVCCDAGQVCLDEQCVDPLGDCLDSFDCGVGAFCEPTLDQCLPQFDPVGCEYVPEFTDLNIVEEWAYTAEEVISVPAIADVDGDGVTEVVIMRTGILDPGNWNAGGVAVLDGRDGSVEWQMDNMPAAGQHGGFGRSTLGVSDVDGDGLPDIIFAASRTNLQSPIRAFDGMGNELWESHDATGAIYRFSVDNGAPTFGNFDGDPEAEIVFGASIIDNDGLVVWDEGGNGEGPAFGSPSVYQGGIAAVADLTGDGYAEIVTGRHAWGVDWDDSVFPPIVTVTQFWDANSFITTPDGYPAIADLDSDGNPEVVLVAEGTIRVLEGNSGRLWCGIDPDQSSCFLASARTQPHTLPSDGGAPGLGGPPTIADFDGDGRPEVGAAGASSYTVFDFNRAGEDVVVQPGFPAPAAGAIYPRWARVTQDQSSNSTGSSVFDFQGDGAAEVIYGDECYMRVYDGSDGTIVLEIESSSATIHEYPVVVDVDGDGNSEIVVANNESDLNCEGIPGYNYLTGLRVYGDANDQWVPTRSVWTSHAYHVTNATSAGNYPVSEPDNWTEPGLNNYRQNVQGEGVFNAPDLTVDLTASLASCENEMLDIVATVRNQGNLGVPSNIEVRLYNGVDDTGVFIGSEFTTMSLLPGATTQVTWSFPFEQGDPTIDFYVTVDGDDAAAGIVTECDESNNSDVLPEAECIFPG